LRVLGRGATQQQAVNELLSLPQGHPFRRNLLEILSNWRINVQLRQNPNEENRELLMNLSPAYLEWREATLQEGIQQHRKKTVQNIIKSRFGLIDEELTSIIDASLQVSDEELIPLLLNCSREDLLQRSGEV
jgi:hypothetical protein